MTDKDAKDSSCTNGVYRYVFPQTDDSLIKKGHSPREAFDILKQDWGTEFMKAQSAWIPDASEAFCGTCVDSTAAQASTANGAARNLRSAFAQHAANASSPGVGGRSNQQAN
eukprot:428923-Rhodomonas_salina.1